MSKFHKMHGLSNDFAVFDARREDISFSRDEIIFLSNRKTGIGFDQLVIMKPPKSPDADVFMDMYNADGSPIGACGNASRCVAALMMKENGKDRIVLQTVSGLLETSAAKGDKAMITVDMGAPKLDWREIPLAVEYDTLYLPLFPLPGERDGVRGCAVSMGNPHCVFFVDDAEAVDLEKIGSEIENHEMFPERTNVEFVTVKDRGTLRMRVWERGTGVTCACGTGSCASAVAAARRGIADRKCEVVLDGGSLFIEWDEKTGHVLMTGSATHVFEGRI